MDSVNSQRVLSGMRPTGALHLGHLYGVLKNWARLQHEHECFFFVADWHALTTDYENPHQISKNTWNMIIDWLAAGVNPNDATLFIQSKVPQHAELHLLLSMGTPVSWLERVPTYKDQQLKLTTKDLSSYGFLGYPLLQSADVLLYKASSVPVGEDQVAHIELTREVARRFNHLYGREVDFEEKVTLACRKMGKKNCKNYKDLRRAYREKGDAEALDRARILLAEQQNITIGERDRLLGYLEGEGRVILPEPHALLAAASKMPGLDGQKMSKSYGNTINLRDAPKDLHKKIKTMPTDPARVRLTDAGDPEKCPVWQMHQIFSDEKTKEWVQDGCRNASIGCIQCKTPIMDVVVTELEPFQARVKQYEADPEVVRGIIADGCERARDVAENTLEEVRQVMGLNYR